MDLRVPGLILLLLWLAGCPLTPEGGAPAPSGVRYSSEPINPEPVPPGQQEPEIPDESDESQSASENPIRLQVLDWEETQALIASHRGKIVVVDLWSTSCEPCILEFPNLIALSRRYPDQVACISVSTDYQGLPSRPLEFYEEKVSQFLQEQNATIDNVLCSLPADTLFFDVLHLGSIPAIYIYNQAGEEVKVFTGLQENDEELSYEKHIIPYVESLLRSL